MNNKEPLIFDLHHLFDLFIRLYTRPDHQQLTRAKLAVSEFIVCIGIIYIVLVFNMYPNTENNTDIIQERCVNFMSAIMLLFLCFSNIIFYDILAIHK